jgi:hypothetical protein
MRSTLNGATMAEANKNDLEQYKSQPWILWDTVAAKSFLLGDTRPEGLAIGSSNPAINGNGEMVWFQDRTEANFPAFTNMDQKAQLAYGMEVWAAYLMLKFPTLNPLQGNRTDLDGGIPATPVIGPPPSVKLAEVLLHFAVVELGLGQENQAKFSSSRFGAGGGLVVSNVLYTQVQNSLPQKSNVLAFPEPIEMPRTQNFAVKLRIAPELKDLIGTLAAPGVGVELTDYQFNFTDAEGVTTLQELPQPPWAVEFGLIGRRIKMTQYGQVPAGKAV